jgi:IS605 OrfB family transposase
MLRLRSGLFSRFKKGMTKEKPKGSGYDLIKLLPKYKRKKKFAWPKGINAQVLKDAVLNKVLSSQNFRKQRHPITVLHERVRRKRFDFLSKISRKIADENQVIYLENLSVRNRVKNRKLSKSIQDAGWGEFVRQLSYKGNVVKIGRWERSTGVCAYCGYKGCKLHLDDRQWICPHCHKENDRDISCAIVINKIEQGFLDSKSVETDLCYETLQASTQVSFNKSGILL